VSPVEPARVIDTIVASGVAAADMTLRAGNLARASALGLPTVGVYREPVATWLPWSDPTQWLRQHREAAGFAADWWGLVRPPDVTQPVRLNAIGLTAGDDLAVLLRLLAQGRYVGSAVAQAEGTDAWQRRAGWTWPLRIAVAPGIGLHGGAEAIARLRSYAPWWDTLTRTVDFEGRWARASLGVVTHLPAEPRRVELRAAVAVALVGPDEPVDMSGLVRCAEVYQAAAVAAVDAGAEPELLLAELVVALADDQPLDVALFTAARSAGRPDPIIMADRGFLDTTRMLRVLAETLPEFRPGPDPSDPIGRITRGGAASDVRVASDLVPWSDGAAQAATLLARERVEARRQPRETLQAEVIDRASGEVVRQVLPGCAYALRVLFTQPTDNRGETRLRFIVTDLAGRASVPAEPTDVASSDQVETPAPTFPFVAGPVGSRIEWRIIVTHGLRFLQTGVLRGVVGGDGLRFEREAVARAGTDELDLASRHDLALVLNHDDAGTRLLTTIAADAVDIHRLTGSGEIDEMAILLDRQAEEPEQFGDYASDAYRDLMVRLAMAGRALYKGLFGRLGVVPDSWQERLLAARRISILSARPGDILPLELVYTKALRLTDAAAGHLCDYAHQYVDPDSGGCEKRCPNASAPDVVCPYGFWGASKIVERHVNRAASTGLAKDYALAVGPDIERHALSLDVVVAAASDRADCNDVRTWSVAAAAIVPTPEVARTWQDLRSLVARLREQDTPPQVLMLVPHVARDVNRQPVLEIGSGDVLDRHGDLAPIVDDREPANPLVLLMGCGTATARSPLFDEPARFLGSGAPGVIGTLTTVRGRHIVPIAVELLRALREQAAAAEGAQPPLGEALLRTRRRGLASGNATVLALLPFGDTDWELRP
jgi:hypothetical protein